MASELPRLLDTASKFALFLVSGLKDEKLIKKYKPTRKLKHTNSILQSFEYFCQISSNLILIIFSYLPLQNWCIFLRHSVETVVSLVTCQPQLTSTPIAEFFVEKVDEVRAAAAACHTGNVSSNSFDLLDSHYSSFLP